VGRVFAELFHAGDDEVYKGKEYEFLPGSYQRTCRDYYLEKAGKKIEAGGNSPHLYFSS